MGMIAGQISQIPFDKRRFQWKFDFFQPAAYLMKKSTQRYVRGVYGHVRRQCVYTWYILPLGWFYATKPTCNQKSSLARSRSKFGFSFPWFTGNQKNAVDVSNLSKSYNLLMARVWKVSWVRGVGKLLAVKIVVSEMYLIWYVYSVYSCTSQSLSRKQRWIETSPSTSILTRVSMGSVVYNLFTWLTTTLYRDVIHLPNTMDIPVASSTLVKTQSSLELLHLSKWLFFKRQVSVATQLHHLRMYEQWKNLVV